MARGTQFEIDSCNFLEKILEDLGYIVIEARRQKSGTQNGFDVLIIFLDEYEQERRFHFECKDYTTELSWNQVFTKIMELSSTKYEVDGFFAISPKKNISNINHNVLKDLPSKVNFPIRHWTPETYVNDYFSLNSDIYRSIYREEPREIDVEKTKKRIKANFSLVLQEKDALNFSNKILIDQANKNPKEKNDLRTTLDEKLNSLFDKQDPSRMKYHQQRCDYKVYLEELQDLNNQLRNNILGWQDNLRIKADRLTGKFQIDPGYTPEKFFFDFFDTAEKDLNRFFDQENLRGDEQKLLHGVVFELAAECPLNWNKNE